MSNQKYSKVNASLLLREANIAIRETIDVQSGKLHELEPAEHCGRRALVFEDGENGVTIGIRVELPQTSSLRNIPASSTESLTLLGAITFSLQGHNAHAKLLSGKQGLEAIMVSRQVCESGLDSSALSEYLELIEAVAQSIEPALALSAPASIEAVLEHVRPVVSAPESEILNVEPVIVPTFDEEARNQMMQKTRQ